MAPPAITRFAHPHLLGVADLSRDDVEAVLVAADAFAELNALHQPPKLRSLRDKTLINLFFENSTRTQASFELAAKRLGATTMNMAVGRSSVSKGETLLDTATTLNAMLPDILVVRHPHSGAVRLLADRMNCAVVNAGDGRCEHPTQALLDALTMRRAFRELRGPDHPATRLEGLTVAICGDVAHSRGARSNILFLQLYGNRVRVVGPPTLAPAALEDLGVERVARLEEAAEGADVIMMLRLQSERMSGAHISSLREYYHAYGLRDEILERAAPDAIVMHPGPMNRGVEIDSELADDSRRSVISRQVEMGVAVRMATLELLAANLPVRASARRRRPEKPPGRFIKSYGAATPGQKGAPPLAFVNALLVDPEAPAPRPGALLVADGRIADIAEGPGLDAVEGLAGSGAEIVDLKGAALAPGLVDLRVFIGEPGGRHRESVASGGEAAAAGGVTTFVMQPATAPVVDDPSVLEFVKKRVKDERNSCAVPRLRVMGALTKGLDGVELAEHFFLQRADAVALGDGGRPMADALVLKRCMENAAALGMVVVCEPQDPHLSAGTCATAGAFAFRLGLPAAPAVAEAMALERDLALAELTGVKYHAAQISTAAAVDALRRARARGVDATASASAAHLLLSEEDIGLYRTFRKLDPPLRSAEDRDATLAALAEGVVDCVVSSHLPLCEDAKRVPYEEAAPGGVGLETLLSAGLEIAARAEINLCRLFEKMSLNPAKRFGFAAGRLAQGAAADLVAFDPTTPREINRHRLRSKSKNAPFDRMTMRGRVLRTLVDGRVIYENDEDQSAGGEAAARAAAHDDAAGRAAPT